MGKRTRVKNKVKRKFWSTLIFLGAVFYIVLAVRALFLGEIPNIGFSIMAFIFVGVRLTIDAINEFERGTISDV
ncbi:hypothetical protein [Peribacillus frigoritolerans]|uniref:Uncharacterized protein n=1 Tax=Peribacillus castrilensis TaxID=2897690 RepID=A0AAW9NJ63_9BACI|nr:hypothetical protein [Peribacillus castrilensis]